MPRFTPRPVAARFETLRRAGRRRWSQVLGVALLLGLLPVGAEPARKSFDLPADVAERTLKLFSRQAGIEVIFPSAVTKDVRTKPVKGAMTARQALDLMLVDTGLALIEDATGAFTVRRETHDPNDQRVALATAGDRPTGRIRPRLFTQLTHP